MVLFDPPTDGPNSNIIYLVDNPEDDSESVLYEVRFDSTAMEANLEEVATLAGFTSAHIGTTWDGALVYAVDQNTSELGVYDVDAETWTILEDGDGIPVNVNLDGTAITGIVQVTFRPDGLLYVASQDTDTLYKVDTETGDATSLGLIYPYGYWPANNGPEIDLSGADITFDVIGNLYLYTNASNDTVSKGLYWVDYEPEDATLPCQATPMEYTVDDTVTGLALDYEGTGDLCFSCKDANTIMVVNRGSFDTETYTMMLDGEEFDHYYGDLSIAFGTWLGGDDDEESSSDPYLVCEKDVELQIENNSSAPCGTVHAELYSDGQLTVTVDSDDTWDLVYTALNVDLAEPTLTDPTEFPYIHSDLSVDTDEFTIDMGTDFSDWEPGDYVYLSCYAKVNNGSYAKQAWAEGTAVDRCHATYFVLDCAAQDCHYEGWKRQLLVRNCESFDAGWVYGEPDCDNGRLYITFEMEDGWRLDQAYVHISAEEPTGILPDTMFYHLNLNGATEDMFSIDVLNDVPDFDCGDTLYIATEAIIFQVLGDGEPQYATDVLAYQQGTCCDGSAIAAERSDPTTTLGEPDGPGLGSFYSLGFDLTEGAEHGGYIDLGFGHPIYNGEGTDINTVEITWNRYSDAEELAGVYVVDRDGEEHFCGTASNFDGDGSRTGISHLAIPDDLNFLEFVRIKDITDINTQSSSDDGYDIDAVSVNYLARYKAAFSWHGNWQLWFTMPCVAGDTTDDEDEDDGDDDDTSGFDCAMTTNLLAGQHMLAGSVFAGVTAEGMLTVIITNVGDWTMDATHLYVGLTAPTNSAPGQFPYMHESLGGVTTDTYTIDMTTDFPDWEQGDPIYIATHAEAEHPTLGSQTAWSEGTAFGNSWAMYITLHCQ